MEVCGPDRATKANKGECLRIPLLWRRRRKNIGGLRKLSRKVDLEEAGNQGRAGFAERGGSFEAEYAPWDGGRWWLLGEIRKVAETMCVFQANLQGYRCPALSLCITTMHNIRAQISIPSLMSCVRSCFKYMCGHSHASIPHIRR